MSINQGFQAFQAIWQNVQITIENIHITLIKGVFSVYFGKNEFNQLQIIYDILHIEGKSYYDVTSNIKAH